MTKRFRVPLLLLTPLLAVAGPHALSVSLVSEASAGQVEHAEHTRLSEEMRKLAQRNAWTAVEKNYEALEALEKSGETIDYKEHMLGAEAAHNLGDTASYRARLERAIKVDPKKEALDAISQVDQAYGRVKITIDGKYGGDRTLAAAVPPFAPDERASIGFATNAVATGGGFEGMLPAGQYTIGGQQFTVVAGQDKPVATVDLSPPKKQTSSFQLAYVGPRAEVGVAFTSGGGSSASDTAAGPFGGAGARLGLGVEAGITPTVGIVAEVGYHDLFGAATADGAPLDEVAEHPTSGNSLHMGYGWLGVNVRAGKLRLAAGPLFGAGKATVTGASCGGAACDGFADSTHAVLTGDIKAGGGALGVSYALKDFGKLESALALQGGAMTTGSRVFEWGQLGLTIAPGTPRRTK
jgi:hypothetical protein